MAPGNSRNGASAAVLRTSVGGGTRTSVASSRPRKNVRAAVRQKPADGGGRPQGAHARGPASRKWWVLPLSIALVVSAFVWTYYPVARVQYRETREKVRLQSELDALKARNRRLGTQVASLQTPEGVEDYARTQLGLVRKGEHVVVVVDGTESREMTTTAAMPILDSDEEMVAPPGRWVGVLDLIFGVR